MARSVENVTVYKLDSIISFSGFLSVLITSLASFGKYVAAILG